MEVVFFTGRMPFLLTNQQCQSTEGKNRTPLTCSPQAHLVSSNNNTKHNDDDNNNSLTAIFQANLELLELRMMEVVVTTEAVTHVRLQSNHHHQQTNTQIFTGRMPFLSPNQQC